MESTTYGLTSTPRLATVRAIWAAARGERVEFQKPAEVRANSRVFSGSSSVCGATGTSKIGAWLKP